MKKVQGRGDLIKIFSSLTAGVILTRERNKLGGLVWWMLPMIANPNDCSSKKHFQTPEMHQV